MIQRFLLFAFACVTADELAYRRSKIISPTNTASGCTVH
jgi:multidrug efflux pump subunit AcrA (membrane-fusion protein)